MFPTRYEYRRARSDRDQRPSPYDERRERDARRGTLLIAAIVAVPILTLGLVTLILALSIG